MARLNYNSPSRTNTKQTKPATFTNKAVPTASASTTSRSYHTLDFDTPDHNPFQDPQSSSAAAVAPIPSDTIASSTSSSTIRTTTSRTKQLSSATATTNTSSSNNRSIPSTKSATTTKTNITTTTTTSRALASGQNDRLDLKDDDNEGEEYKDIPGDRDNMDDNHGGELEDHDENPLIHLTANQREAAIENLDIETMDRIQKLRASIGVLTNSLKFRAEAEMNRLPAAIRAMTVEEFWFTYNGSAKEYLEQQAKSKTVANTAFLHALGVVDQKRKRETPGPTDDLWQQKKRNRDEQRQKQPQTSGYNSGNGSLSSSTSQHRPTHQSARHNPYPAQQQQQQRRHQSPFVGSRTGRG